MGSSGGGSPGVPQLDLGGVQSTLDSWKRNYVDPASRALDPAIRTASGYNLAKDVFDPSKKDLGGSIARGVKSVGKGAENIARGNVKEGVEGMVGGANETLTGGALNRLGIMSSETRDMYQAEAQAEEERLVKEGIAARETARRDAIRKRIDAEVAMRMRAPGKSQTLLTTLKGTDSLLPTGNNTLLTLGR